MARDDHRKNLRTPSARAAAFGRRAPDHHLDLQTLSLTAGEGRRIEGDVRIEPVRLGGVDHPVKGGTAPYRLEISRTGAGYAFHLRLDAALTGPCERCLEDAHAEVHVDSREVDQPRAGEEELTSPYVREEILDLGAWARDALILDAPGQILCRPDCAGLCPVCGESLNDADPEAHRHAQAASPFANLSDLLPE
jgi:DUF177 domain-containing protein